MINSNFNRIFLELPCQSGLTGAEGLKRENTNRVVIYQALKQLKHFVRITIKAI